MVQLYTDSHLDIVNKIIEQVREKLPEDQHMLLEKFIAYYYATVADEDLLDHNVMDLYGAVISHWGYLASRAKDETKIRVFNPNYEQHGWQSKHTIIEICVPDLPFLVDSVRMRLSKLGYTIHLMITPSGIFFERDGATKIRAIKFTENSHRKLGKGCTEAREAVMYIEIDHQPDEAVHELIQKELTSVYSDVSLAVNDWQSMREKANDTIQVLEQMPDVIQQEERDESIEFMRWIANNNFTFLGYREYELVGEPGDEVLRAVSGSGLGLLRDERIQHRERPLAEFSEEAKAAALSTEKILIIQQLSTASTVHRPSPPYYIGIKLFNTEGKVVGERRFIGLYTSVAYHSSPMHIPMLRRKVSNVLEASEMVAGDHSWRNLLNIMETYPRDELFQSSEDELFSTAMGIFHLQERRRIRLFLRKDIYGRFYSCLVYVPRDRFNSALREKIGEILSEELSGREVDFVTQFSESLLARIHFVVRYHGSAIATDIDVDALERKIAQAARTWEDDLGDSLREFYGEAKANQLISTYRHAFAAGYRESYQARTAVFDIEHMETLSEDAPISMSLYRPLESLGGNLHFKLYSYNMPMALSDVLPMLENMGLKVIGERSFEIQPEGRERVWLNDFSMYHADGQSINVDKVRDLFQEAFAMIWLGYAENDGFNRLTLTADLNWRETAILRTYAKYMRQIGVTFSQTYIEDTLAKSPNIVRKLVGLFKLRFSPNRPEAFDLDAEKQAIIAELEHVDSLDEDRIFRHYVDLVCATLRTNFYQDNGGKSYISLKIDPQAVPGMPLPKPMFEFFVYSPRVEGVHLRSAKVARGGLRWSDRREDFRTEVLGLMKAQQVKNAVIVPAGAKGGFVAKALPDTNDRDVVMEEVVSCYRTFISGILDLTDNLNGHEVIHPEDTVIYDDDDYYLVVAADKGTATFSDIANSISLEYGFWLGDAFASGGSTGYDHKKMGITARGAWESVKCHFLERGVDVQKEDFSVVGVGDMGGDVFGNGMLLSEHIKLVGAFNHMHIFIDPDPDPKTSFHERQRLFELPRSSWADYNKKLISAGGGVYNRSAKSIPLSNEVKELLGLDCDAIVPNDLIQAMLKAEVDLIWNGGIGTYVKGSGERNEEVGDRANDVLRINGSELRCKVVGEGGNLGLTQLGRIEYALSGGVSFTDFIDNAGGVDCSDHEVNIKILLNSIANNGDLTEKQRNQLLADMTDEVATLVLENNINQTRAISLAAHRARKTLDEYHRFIHALERNERLDRALEYLPDEDQLAERKASGQGLTRPEISVLLAYSKIVLKEQLLDSNIPEDPYLSQIISTAFPACLSDKFSEVMHDHHMRREIIATQLSNAIANEMGATFVMRLFDETGAPAHVVARCYICVREIFEVDALWDHLKVLESKVERKIILEIMVETMRLLRRATRWFLRNRRKGMDLGETIGHFKPKVRELSERIEDHLVGAAHDKMKKVAMEYEEAGLPNNLASRVAVTDAMLSALDIIEASTVNDIPVLKVAETYFAIGACLQLDWFRTQIGLHPVGNNWDALARAACRDDLDRQQRSITEGVLNYQLNADDDANNAMEAWITEHNILVERWFYMVADLKATKVREFSMFAVALRELLDLAQAGSAKSVVN